MYQLWLVFAGMLGGMTACVLVRPYGLRVNDGMSYYGTFKSTVLPYGIALLSATWLLAAISRRNHHYPGWIRWAFEGFSILIVGILLTPYTLGTLLNVIHTTLGSILFAGQLVTTGALALQRKQRTLSIIWLLELLAGIMCAVYVLPAKGYLFEWQLAFQLLFIGFLLAYETSLRQQLGSSSDTS